MKGPGYRYDIDIRRTWECPACHRRIRLPGHVTQKRCSCQDQPTWMKLLDIEWRRTFPKREKIVIPDEEPEPIEKISTPESSRAEEDSPVETTASPDSRDEDILEDNPSEQSASITEKQEETSETIADDPARKKRRRKRKRKRDRDSNQSSERTPDSSSSQNDQSSSQENTPNGGEDFGAGV